MKQVAELFIFAEGRQEGLDLSAYLNETTLPDEERTT
jgi:hypothetical protein